MGEYVLLIIILIIVSVALIRLNNSFDIFMDGVKEGLTTVVKIIPPLIGLITAATVLRASGFIDALTFFINPAALKVGIPSGAVPLILLRPVSGSGSLALLTDILVTFGADSETARFACVVMGSTETTLYTLTVYFGAAGIKRTRHAPAAAVLSDFTCVVLAAIILNLFY